MNFLVTGISRGLGRAIARPLLDRGDSVWGISRKNENDSAFEEFRGLKNFTYSSCDLSDEKQILCLLKNHPEECAGLDAVILNAASMGEDYIGSCFDYSKFREIFEINFLGNLRLIEKLLPVFQKKEAGSFIAISSLSAYQEVVLKRIAYPASKAALNSSFRAFRLQPENRGIRFISINFGGLGGRSGLLSLSYEDAARKVLSVFHSKKNSCDLPWVAACLTKILSLLPESFVSELVKKRSTRHIS